MENVADQKSLILQDVPEVPALPRGKRRELTGFAKIYHDYRLGRIGCKELEEQGELLAKGRSQLLYERIKVLTDIWRTHAAAVKEAFITAAEEYVQFILDSAQVRINANKHAKVNEAITNYYDLLSSLREDLPDDLRQISIETGRGILNKTIDDIIKSRYHIEDSLNRPSFEKRGFLDRLRA